MHRRNLSVVAAASIALAVAFGNPSTANAAPGSAPESSQSSPSGSSQSGSPRSGSSQSSSSSSPGASETGDAGNSGGGSTAQISELQEQIEKLNAEMLAAADTSNQATGQAGVAKEAAKQAGEDYDAAVIAADEAKAKAYEVAADMYKQGPLSLEQMSLLTANGPQDFIDKSTMMQQVADYQSGYVNQMVQAEAAQQAAKFAADQASADADAKATEAQQISADVQAKLTTAQQQLDALMAQAGMTGTGSGGDIPAYASAVPAGASSGQVTGDWAKPVNGATLTSTFGPRWGSNHEGIDLAAPIGTPIYAAGSGVVLRAGPATGFGLAVYLQHSNGDVTVYGHINSFFVQTGQTVTAGQPIAEVGNRGYSTGPHLHFEVQTSAYGQRIDPIGWLAARGISVPSGTLTGPSRGPRPDRRLGTPWLRVERCTARHHLHSRPPPGTAPRDRVGRTAWPPANKQAPRSLMSSPDDAREPANPPPPRHFSAQHLSGRGAGPPAAPESGDGAQAWRHTSEQPPEGEAPHGQFSGSMPSRMNGWIPAPTQAPAEHATPANLTGRTGPSAPPSTPNPPPAPTSSTDSLGPQHPQTPTQHASPPSQTPPSASDQLQGFRLRRPNLGASIAPSPGPTADTGVAPIAPVAPAASHQTGPVTGPTPVGGARPAPPQAPAPSRHTASNQPPATGPSPLSPPATGPTDVPPRPVTGPSPVPGRQRAEAPSAQDNSARLRAVSPEQAPQPESGPVATPPPPQPVSDSTPAPTEGVTQFTEPGRSHLGPGGDFNAQATPAHLDPRVAGLTQAPQRRARVSQFFHRAPDDVTAGNPTSGALTARIDLPRRISVVGLKGGVGKTTLSILLAKTAARERHQPVMILDSDTTYGSLALRTGVVPIASAHDIARMGDPGSRQVFATSVSRTEEDVWVLPTGRSPEQSANFTDRTYVEAMRAVYRHFPIIVTDCGAGMAGPLMQRVISASHALVIATSPSMDGILASHNALQWLASLGYTDLLQRTIVAMSNVATPPQIDLAATRERFAQLCRGLVTIPTDPHLSPGSQLTYSALSDETRKAARDLTSVTLEAALAFGIRQR